MRGKRESESLETRVLYRNDHFPYSTQGGGGLGSEAFYIPVVCFLTYIILIYIPVLYKRSVKGITRTGGDKV